MLLGVDVGGTFTDAVLVGADSAVHTAKVPSTPAEQSVGVLEAVRLVLARAGAEARQVERFAHGMTVATNALLEGRTARTALIATAGFTDVIELGRQARAHLYELCLSGPAPLVPAELRFAAPERTGPDGPLRALDPAARASPRARDRPRPTRGGRGVAAALLRPSRARAPARRAARRARCPMSTSRSPAISSAPSASTSARPRPFSTRRSPRCWGHTCAACPPDARARGLPEPQIMQSSGGLTDSERAAAHAALTVLSGPAGGVGGALLLAELARRAERALLRHGRHLLRRLPDRRRPGRRDRRADGRGTAAVAAGTRHPHRRRGRRLDRLARSRRRAARGTGLGGRRSRTGLLWPGARGSRVAAADRHRRQPPARPPARGFTARGRAHARPLRGRARGLRARARARPGRARLRGRDRPRGRGGDAGRPARDDRRAGNRPPRASS